MGRSRGKIRLELSRQTAALAALAGVVALVWMFVFGVFIGRRYSPDTYVARPPVPKTASLERPPAAAENQPAEKFAADLARQKREVLAAPGPEKPDLAYAVQIGAFSEEQRAHALVAELVKEGYQAYLFTGTTSPRFRVRLGPYGKRQEAERAGAAVGQKLGIKPYLLNVAGGQGQGAN
jgi:cell division septation protein DedD